MTITNMKIRIGLHFSDRPSFWRIFFKACLIPWFYTKFKKPVTRKRVLTTLKKLVELKIYYTAKFASLGGSSGSYELEHLIELALNFYDLSIEGRKDIYDYFPKMFSLDYFGSKTEQEKRKKFLAVVENLIVYYKDNKSDLR